MTRVLYIIAQPVRWVAFEWIARELDRSQFELSFLLLNDGVPPLQGPLEALGCHCYRQPFRTKRETPRAAMTVAALCRRHAYHIVHCHFMGGCLAGLPGAAIAGLHARIHTRHHAGPFSRQYRPWWGKFYDRFNNRLSTRIVAPSREVERALTRTEGVPAEKIVRIEHGFDLARFADVPPARVEALRRKYPRMCDGGPVIGVVARFESFKGVHLTIQAFRELLRDYPRARLVLANARGSATAMIRKELSALPPETYLEIPFEEEMPALYHLFHIFAHTPIAPELEAFGQVYVEAWAAGVPAVITPAGIAAEVARHGVNAYVVEFGSAAQILEGFRTLLNCPEWRRKLAANGRVLAQTRFGLARMVRSLERLYTETLLMHNPSAPPRSAPMDTSSANRLDISALAQRIRSDLARTGSHHCRAGLSFEQYDAMCKLLGPIEARTDIIVDAAAKRPTNSPDANRPSVYSPSALELHTDRPSAEILAWYCIAQDEEDGAIRFIDAAALFEDISAEELRVLESVPVRYYTEQPGGSITMSTEHLLSGGGPQKRLYYAPWLVEPGLSAEQQSAVDGFAGRVAHAAATAAWCVRLEPTDCLFIDNRRLMHGRGALSENSRRHLVRYLIQAPPAGP